jgi:MoaA/NifB/PqqE/SkfB family radical SAM enzyme
LLLKAGYGHGEGIAQLNFERIFSLFQPEWDWIQVEVTSACNAACIYCPRTVYKGSWQDRHLPLEMFKKLEPAFSRTGHVHLQGWGEPLLHPDFFEMVAVAKASGCRVGTTTNGMLLNMERTDRLIESGVDVIAFSLAGTGEKNDLIRKGTNLNRVLETIRRLQRQKKEKTSPKPEIHIAYMLFRSSLDDLGRLPSLLEGLGVGQVVVSTLDFIPSEDLEDEAILPSNEAEYEEVVKRLDDLVRTGERKGLDIHYRVICPGVRRRVCTENVQRAVCVSSDGAVSACVYTNLQVPGASYVWNGKRQAYERMVFGNIGEEPLSTIWRKKVYSAFRRSFNRGHLASPCLRCLKLLGE